MIKIDELENRLSEAKAKMDVLESMLSDIGEEEAEPEVKPVFPQQGVVLRAHCRVQGCSRVPGYIKQGNTFYSCELSKKEAERRAAEVRVREAINIANKGDNGFKIGEHNYIASVDYSKCAQLIPCRVWIWEQQSYGWLYLRSSDDTEKLIRSPGFVSDWKLMMGIE